MPTEHKKLGDPKWEELKPLCVEAAQYTEKSYRGWAGIAAAAVAGYGRQDYRWIIADLRERCFDAGISCPFSVIYLVQLAETHDKWDGNLDRDVPISVLVELRNLEDRKSLLTADPKMTVSKAKAIVMKRLNEDTRSVEEIEAEQKRARLDGREKSKSKDYAEKLAGIDNVAKLLPELVHIQMALSRAIARCRAEGKEFPAGDLGEAESTTESLLREIRASRTHLSEVA